MNTFSDFYFRTYSAQTWSFEHFFCLFSYFLIFALPFYFAFAGSSTPASTQISGSTPSTPSSPSPTHTLGSMP